MTQDIQNITKDSLREFELYLVNMVAELQRGEKKISDNRIAFKALEEFEKSLGVKKLPSNVANQFREGVLRLNSKIKKEIENNPSIQVTELHSKVITHLEDHKFFERIVIRIKSFFTNQSVGMGNELGRIFAATSSVEIGDTKTESKEIKSRDQVLSAIQTGQKIDGIDPIDYAQANNIKLRDKEQLAAKGKAISDLLEDKKVAEVAEFKNKSDKKEGVSSGYQAQRGSDGHLFMLKKFHKTNKEPSELSVSEFTDNFSFVNEFVMAPFFKRWLYDAAPHVELVKDNNTGELFIRSKFLHDFVSVHDYSKNHSDELQKIEGMDKKFAADMMGLEQDRHKGNTGLMDRNGTLIPCKIDHGQSAMNTFTNPMTMWKNFSKYMQSKEYTEKVSLNPTKQKEALVEMSKMSDEEIDKIVKSRIHILKNNGLDFSKNPVIMGFFKDAILHADDNKAQGVELRSEADAVKHFSNMLKNQKKVTQLYIKEVLSVIEKMDMPKEWFKGQWIKDIDQKEPLQWAVENAVKIEGKNPLLWAVQNKMNIEGKDPIKWAEKNNIKIEGMDARKWVAAQKNDSLSR